MKDRAAHHQWKAKRTNFDMRDFFAPTTREMYEEQQRYKNRRPSPSPSPTPLVEVVDRDEGEEGGGDKESSGSDRLAFSKPQQRRPRSTHPAKVIPLEVEDIEDSDDSGASAESASQDDCGDGKNGGTSPTSPRDEGKGRRKTFQVDGPKVKGRRTTFKVDDDRGRHGATQSEVKGRRATFQVEDKGCSSSNPNKDKGHRATYHSEVKGRRGTGYTEATTAQVQRRATFQDGGGEGRRLTLGRLPTPDLSETSEPVTRHHLDRTTPSLNGLLIPTEVENYVPYSQVSSKYRRDMKSTAPIHPAGSCSKILHELVEEEEGEKENARNSRYVDPSVPHPVSASESPYRQKCTKRSSSVSPHRGGRAGHHVRVLDLDENIPSSPSCQTCGYGVQQKMFHPVETVAAVQESDGCDGFDRSKPRTSRMYSPPPRSRKSQASTADCCRKQSRAKSSMQTASLRGSVSAKSNDYKAWSDGLKAMPKSSNPTIAETANRLSISREKPASKEPLYSKMLPQFSEESKGRSSAPAAAAARLRAKSSVGRKTTPYVTAPKGVSSRAPRRNASSFSTGRTASAPPIQNVFSRPSHLASHPQYQHRATHPDVDQLSLSSMSLSNCSVASEVLERAKKRHVNFWTSKQQPHE